MKELDIASYLKTEDDYRVFLQEVAETGTASDFVHALGIVARAKGMAQVAADTGVTRTALYQSLSDAGNPTFSTVFGVMQSLGLKFAIA
ncbi:putative addiction module antidote protein [Moraxella caviae]|uniref:Predicted transcriptional regulator n=1 Tax=Moraxella caviae TaxID=34060 RepID=A0A1S9ZVL4_9GAMM|nr:addiction module antidote protein [Moraxella caviae]OOR87480.1 putative addiction module antidote protein [Moraxella caviae]STZ10619.1 Predicted transcriptional regulator [Moraxella caviae]